MKACLKSSDRRRKREGIVHVGKGRKYQWSIKRERGRNHQPEIPLEELPATCRSTAQVGRGVEDKDEGRKERNRCVEGEEGRKRSRILSKNDKGEALHSGWVHAQLAEEGNVTWRGNFAWDLKKPGAEAKSGNYLLDKKSSGARRETVWQRGGVAKCTKR